MFSQIRLKNFYSFKDVTFDLRNGNNAYKQMAIVYGENGSGKTNLLSGVGVFIDLMRTMDVRDIIEKILYDQDHPKSEDEPRRKLPPQILSRMLRSSESLFNECRMIGNAEPVFLQYEFVINGKTGIYTVEFAANGILHERLEYVLEKRRGVYFDLTTEKKSVNKAIYKNETIRNDLNGQLNRFWGKHTFLAIIMHEVNDKAEQYINDGLFDNFLAVLNAFSRVSCDINSNINHHALISGLEKGLLLIEIESGNIQKSDENVLDRTEAILTSMFKSISSDNKELYYKRDVKNDGSIDYGLRIKKMIAGEIRDLPFEYESFGNHQIVNQLPFLFRALMGETVVLDESDSGIHDLLYLKIISEAKECITGQLIITTHNTLLLEIPDIKDSVYLLKEDENANRKVVPITDAGERIYQQTSIRNKYLQGAYGGSPLIEKINFKAILDIANSVNHS